MTPARIDDILALQLGVAWVGEADTPPLRLLWWHTAMGDPGAGEDLFQRLAPATWKWATLEAARLAARRTDDAGRKRCSVMPPCRAVLGVGERSASQWPIGLLQSFGGG